VAKQQGFYVARAIDADLRGGEAPDAFRYRDVGQLATIGRRAALVDLGWLRFRGWLAWWFWGIVHIYFLINNRSRLSIALQWLWSYLTFDRGARLIVQEKPPVDG
jgi:NADH dehydrogenase